MFKVTSTPCCSLDLVRNAFLEAVAIPRLGLWEVRCPLCVIVAALPSQRWGILNVLSACFPGLGFWGPVLSLWKKPIMDTP